MKDFIYDYYGYNVETLKDNSFIFQDYNFLIAACNEDEEGVSKLNGLITSLQNVFEKDVVYIVKNKYDKFISNTNDNNICLLTYKNSNNININHFIKMHLSYINSFNYKVDINEIIALWDQRLEYIQNQCLLNLNFDNESHLTLYEYTLYSIGFALNALQYLSDIQIDFLKEKYISTLTHRRIKKMDKFELFNPFNFIIDHSSRDLAELYKNDLIDIKSLLDICSYYGYSIDEYEYLLARLLYPTFIFDIVEDIATDNFTYDFTSQIYYAIAKQNKQIDKLKKLYDKLSSTMNIRPIEWLKNFNH